LSLMVLLCIPKIKLCKHNKSYKMSPFGFVLSGTFSLNTKKLSSPREKGRNRNILSNFLFSDFAVVGQGKTFSLAKELNIWQSTSKQLTFFCRRAKIKLFLEHVARMQQRLLCRRMSKRKLLQDILLAWLCAVVKCVQAWLVFRNFK